MKIAVVSGFFGESVGGAEISTRLWVDELLKENILVEILTFRDCDNRGSEDYNVFKIPFLNKLPTFLLSVVLNTNLFDKFLSVLFFKRFKETKPDVIHVQDILLLPAIIRAAKRLNIPVLQTARDERFLCNLPIFNEKVKILSKAEYLLRLKRISRNQLGYSSLAYLLSPFLYPRSRRLRQALRECSKVISVSNYIRSSLLRIKLENVLTIYNLMPGWQVRSAGLSREKSIIFANGRIEDYKGFHVLVKSMLLVLQKNKNVHLILSGDGPHLSNLKRLTKKLNIQDHVTYTGKVSYEKVRYFYSISDLVVIPSLWDEPLSRIVWDAFRFGRPVVATDTGGTSEMVIHNKTGLLVKPNDVRELSSAIVKMINDVSFRVSVSDEISKMMQNHNNLQIKKYFEVLNEIF